VRPKRFPTWLILSFALNYQKRVFNPPNNIELKTRNPEGGAPVDVCQLKPILEENQNLLFELAPGGNRFADNYSVPRFFPTYMKPCFAELFGLTLWY
jgi:hypothetical protein